MKQNYCKYCGSVLDSVTGQCPNCKNANYQNAQNPAPANMPPQAFYPAPPVKQTNKTPVAVLIIAAVVMSIAIIGIVAFLVFGSGSSGDNFSDGTVRHSYAEFVSKSVKKDIGVFSANSAKKKSDGIYSVLVKDLDGDNSEECVVAYKKKSGKKLKYGVTCYHSRKNKNATVDDVEEVDSCDSYEEPDYIVTDSNEYEESRMYSVDYNGKVYIIEEHLNAYDGFMFNAYVYSYSDGEFKQVSNFRYDSLFPDGYCAMSSALPEGLKVDNSDIDIDELKMNKSPVCTEYFGSLPAKIAQLGGHISDCIEMDALVILNRIDHRRIGAHGLKERLTVSVKDRVVGADIAAQELLHDIRSFRQFSVKTQQVFFVIDLHRAVCADTDVRFYDHRISHLIHEILRGCKVRYYVLAGSRYFGIKEDALHAGFPDEVSDPVFACAYGDVEIRAESCVHRKPVFIQGLQPVDSAVFVDKKGDCSVHLVVVLERIHVVVFHQRAFELVVQHVIRHIADSEHIHAVHVQAVDKQCAGDRVCRGNKYIIHGIAFLCLADNSSFLIYSICGKPCKYKL